MGKKLFVVALIVIVFYVLPFEVHKMRWDAKVEELCLKEGGVQVVEHVILTQEEYDRNDGIGDHIIITDEYNAKPEYEFVTKSEFMTINEGSSYGQGWEPEVHKVVSTIYRRFDMQRMQVSTNFYRRGGDAPSFSHPSSFSCRHIKELKIKYKENFYSLAEGVVTNG